MEPKPPKLDIEPITNNGVLTIRFDQKMVFPDNPSQEFYNRIFKIVYVSKDGDEKREAQKFSDMNSDRNL